ncbi:MAG: hypothetical protein Q9M33_10680 [Robiginitomaculum sp.]|nr:hypothetical protein [Robiginitomaculum sp.]
MKHVFQNTFGIYYFRYSLPKWLLDLGRVRGKSIYLSLLTRDPKVANFRSRSLWVELQIAMAAAKNNANFLVQNDIHERLQKYRDYMAHAEPYEQNDVYWGTNKFEEVIEAYATDLICIGKMGLLDELEGDFSNIGSLLNLVDKAQKKIDEQRRLTKIDRAISAPAATENDLSGTIQNFEADLPQADITLKVILSRYLKHNLQNDTKWAQKTRDKEKSHFSLGLT